jgi:ribosome-associated toxin RatA of RatAB toxin-antitoxin module
MLGTLGDAAATAGQGLNDMNGLRWLTLCVVLGGTAPLAAAAAAQQQAGAAKVTPELQKGEITSSGYTPPGQSVERGRASVLLDVPADRVIAVVQDYAQYKEFLPNFEASRVLSQRGAAALVFVQVAIMKGAAHIWAELKLKPRKSEGPTHVIEAKMLKGNVDHMEALWEVTPVDAQRTLVSFEIIVDPNLPLPSSLISDENRKTARKTLRALRERVALPAAKAAPPKP